MVGPVRMICANTGNEELDPLTQFSHSDWATFSEKHQQRIYCASDWLT